MKGLTPGQQRQYDAADETCAELTKLDIREASPTEMAHYIGRLEKTVKGLQQTIRELQGGE